MKQFLTILIAVSLFSCKDEKLEKLEKDFLPIYILLFIKKYFISCI